MSGALEDMTLAALRRLTFALSRSIESGSAVGEGLWRPLGGTIVPNTAVEPSDGRSSLLDPLERPRVGPKGDA